MNSSLLFVKSDTTIYEKYTAFLTVKELDRMKPISLIGAAAIHQRFAGKKDYNDKFIIIIN